MNEQELAAIEARVNAATPGPWLQSGEMPVLDDTYVLVGDADLRTRGMRSFIALTGPNKGDRIPNANFIAHARTDVPALVAEVRCSRAERDEAVDAAHWLTSQRADLLIEVETLKEENARLRDVLVGFGWREEVVGER